MKLLDGGSVAGSVGVVGATQPDDCGYGLHHGRQTTLAVATVVTRQVSVFLHNRYTVADGEDSDVSVVGPDAGTCPPRGAFVVVRGNHQ